MEEENVLIVMRVENAFVILPGTALDIRDNPGNLYSGTMPQSTWADPIVHKSWFQNPKPSARPLVDVALSNGEGSCLACHTAGNGLGFPQVSKITDRYCGTFLKSRSNGRPPQIKNTMPPLNDGLSYQKTFCCV